MQQVGLVIENAEGHARVRVQRNAMCSHCGLCGSLHILGGRRDLVVNAENRVGAQPGELVRMETKSSSVLLAATAVYLVPLIGLFVGTGLGTYLGNAGFGLPHVNAPVLGFGLLGLSFLFLRRRERSFSASSRFQPVITGVLDWDEVDENCPSLPSPEE